MRVWVTVDMKGGGGAYINFPQHRKANPVIQLAKLLDLIVAAGVLAAELVAREADNFKVVGVLRLEVLVEFLEPRELRGEAAFGGRVDDEDGFALEGGEVVGCAFFWMIVSLSVCGFGG